MQEIEYLSFIREIYHRRYGEPQEYKPLEENSKIPKKKNYESKDLADVKQEELTKIFFSAFQEYKIGRFIIYIISDKEKNFSLNIYEINQNSIHCKIDPLQDFRFKTCPWISYFNSYKQGKNISKEILVSII